MSEDIAVQELLSLAQIPGALRIITSVHRCGGEEKVGTGFIPGTPEELAACAAFEHGLGDPRHFVVHDVVAIDGPDDRGRYTARSAEDEDWCMGYADALVARLREARVAEAAEA